MSFFVIAGPCVLENFQLAKDIAIKMKDITSELGLDYVFKASFDKANRTSINSFRGPGLELGLEQLQEIKESVGVKVLTDLHESHQASSVAKVVDFMQIPAFLCRQTDLIIKSAEAASENNICLNIKKAQFLGPWDMKNVIQKCEEVGLKKIFLTERGTSFGYNNLVVDFKSIPQMKELGYPVIFDATHSVQLPGGKGIASGGQREFVKPLAKAAIAIGIDGLFIEVHPDPDNALSDGPNMVSLDKVKSLLKELKNIDDVVKNKV